MSLVTGNNSIDSLVYSSWADSAHTPVQLSYSFMTQVPSDASEDDARGFKAMTADQQQAARDAMAKWASVANIVFTQVGSNGDIQLATNNQGSQSSGYAYLPNGSSPTYLFTNNRDTFNTDFTAGTYGPTVLMHELGHTLGLKHPGDYDSTGSSIDGPFLPESTDNGDYTVMSYNVNSGYNLEGKYNITPMLYDIQAIQYLYGANMTYHAANDTYAYFSLSAPQCIWDAGGTDQLDFSACSTAVVINLNAGSFSSTTQGFNNISIAYNVTIEQAVAGSGGSTIICNNAGDLITGGAGADTITEGGGSDTINAGGGSDTVIFGARLASFTLVRTSAGLVVTGEGSDTLTGVETLQFSDGSYSVSDIPLLNKAIADQSAQVGHAFSLALGANAFTSDNGSAPVLSAKLASGAALPSWLSFDAQSGTFSGTASSADSGVLDVRVRAAGSSGVVVSDDFQLVVSAQGSAINGTSGNDDLTAGSGDNTINGGAGRDLVHYQGAQSQYAVLRTADSIKITDLSGSGGVDTLQGVERVEFADNTGLALDTDGTAGQLYRIYGASLGREPKASGFGFWMSALDHGTTLSQVVLGFINSAEFVSRFGSNLSDAGYITQLYLNILHGDTPSAAVINAQVDTMHNNGLTRQDMLVAFADSQANIASLVGVMPTEIAYTPWHG
jgi:hypothetical protein